MIPISLTIKGVYSYKEEQTIDFSELTSEHLFGIFGAVGSGKSSILEAITFSLYGEIERLNRNGLNYNLMNLSSNEMIIDFTFKANNGNVYNTFCHYERNSKNHSVVKGSKSAYLCDVNDFSQKEPIEFDSIKDIIGLSYQNFKRTIIIPQGKFQEFLKLAKKERSEMLQEIFDLDKYNLFDKAKSILTKSLKRQNEIDGSLDTIGEIDIEKPKIIKENIDNLVEEIWKQTNENKLFIEQKNKFDILQKNSLEIKSISEKLTVLESDKSKIDDLKEKLEQFRVFSTSIKPLINRKNELKKQIEEILSAKNQNEKELNNNKTVLAENEAKLKEITPEYENREILIEKANEVKLLIEINNRVGEKQNFENNLNELLELKKNQTTVRETTLAKIKNNDELLSKLKANQIDVNEINEAQNWHNLGKKIISDGKEKKNRYIQTESEIEKIDKSIAKEIAEANFKKEFLSIEDIEKYISEEVENSQNKIQQLELEIAELQLHKQLAQYSNNLHKGKPCPLCGSVEHPNIAIYSDVNNNLTEKNNEKLQLLEYINSLKKFESKLSENNKIKQLHEKNLVEQKKDLDNQREEYKLHEKKFVFSENYKDEKTVIEAIENYKKSTSEIQNLEDEIKNLRLKDEKDILLFNKNEEEIKNSEVKLAELNTIINQLSGRIKQIKIDDYFGKNNEELNLEVELLLNKHLKLTELFSELTQKINFYRNSISKIDGILQGLIEQDKKNRENYTKISQELEKEITKTPNINDEIINNFISEDFKNKDVEQQIKVFENEYTELSIKLKTLKESLSDEVYDKEAHNQISNKIDELNKLIKFNSEQKGKLDKELETYLNQIKIYNDLKKEKDKLDDRIKNLNKIIYMFKGNGFVNYVATYYLQNLCSEANKRFIKLTNGHLELCLNSDNGFDVIDHINNGYKRSCDSLSGGQTFQASLCLALALSDAINRKSNIKQNFFFMDEGFGSLDSKSLKTVFETLQSLYKENRIVGLISHVEDMMHEIQRCLVINNTPERGSIISCNWK